MNHLGKIQTEFIKCAVQKWDNLSYKVQKECLRKHPKSKRKLSPKKTSIKQDVTTFDWRERDDAEEWVADHIKKGLNVFELGAGTDSYILIATKQKKITAQMAEDAGLGIGVEAEELLNNVRQLKSEDDLD